MIVFLVADASGSFNLFRFYPHRFQDYWVSDFQKDPLFNIDVDILNKFGIEPPNFESEPIPVSITFKNWP